MVNYGKCPKCEKKVSRVKIEHVDIIVGVRKAYRGVSYLCGSCNTVLSTSLDPNSMQKDTVKDILKGLRKMRV